MDPRCYSGCKSIISHVPAWVVAPISPSSADQIEDAHESKKVPIVVGGTAYWIQHLIFPGRLAGEPAQASCQDSGSSAGAAPPSDGLSSVLSQLTVDLRQLYDALPEVSAADDPARALALHNLLRALDPVVAARWHWRDTRKVLRNLEIIKNSGRKVSEILQEQSAVALSPRWVPVGGSLFCAL